MVNRVLSIYVLFTIVVISSLFFLYLIYKKNGFHSIYFFYYSLFSAFFLLRSFALFSGLDTPFPEDLLGKVVPEESFFIGLIGYYIWSISFFLFTLSLNSKATTYGCCNQVRDERLLDFSIFLGVLLSIVYILSAILNAGSVAKVIYYLRIDSEFKFGFMSSIPAITLMLIAAQCSIWGVNAKKILLITFLIIIQVVAGDRSGIIFSLVVFIVVKFSLGGMSKLKVALMLPLVFVLASALKYYRSMYQLNIEQESITMIRSISSSLNLNIYDAYYSVIGFVNHGLEFRYGYDFYLGVVGLIPRFLWEGKPEVVNTGVWFAQLFSERKMGTPISSIGEWYLNFGFFGFLLGAIITFFYLKIAESIMPKSKELRAALSLIFVLQVVQSGFSNTSLRETLLFIILVVLPVFMYKKLTHIRGLN